MSGCAGVGVCVHSNTTTVIVFMYLNPPTFRKLIMRTPTRGSCLIISNILSSSSSFPLPSSIADVERFQN